MTYSPNSARTFIGAPKAQGALSEMKRNGKQDSPPDKRDGDGKAHAVLPAMYVNGIEVEPGNEVAFATFTVEGQGVVRLALSPRLIADMPGVWQAAAAQMGLFERNGVSIIDPKS